MATFLTTDGTTGKLCPFAGFTVNTSNASGQNCVKGACQLWVKNRTYPEDDAFTNVYGSNYGYPDSDSFGLFITGDGNDDILYSAGHTAAIDGGRCGAQMSDYGENIFRLLHHLHRNHEHAVAHSECDETKTDCGAAFFGNAIPKSMQLAMEFQTNEDQDGDGKIYGKDFVIKQNKNSPNALLYLTSQYTPRPTTEIDWLDFINRRFYPQIKSIYPRSVSNFGGQLIRVTGSFFSGNLDNFTISFNNTHVIETIDVEIPPENIHIINSHLLYFRTPIGMVFSEFPYDVTFTNDGDTWSSNTTFSWFTDTGGSTLTTESITITSEPSDQDIQDKLEEELAAALA